MKIAVENLENTLRVKSELAQVNKSIFAAAGNSLSKSQSGFRSAEARVYGGMGWIWLNWLMKTAPDEVVHIVENLVDDCLRAYGVVSSQHFRPRFDLLLLHCAIFAASEKQLKRVAEAVMDSRGVPGYEFKGDGDVYAAAWCGMLKHWLLGDLELSRSEFERVRGAYMHPAIRGASFELVRAWLDADWEKFNKLQQKDFQRLWTTVRKDRIVVTSGSNSFKAKMDKISVGQTWCWAHCGLALSAYRQGASVETHDFLFPAHSLTGISRDQVAGT